MKKIKAVEGEEQTKAFLVKIKQLNQEMNSLASIIEKQEEKIEQDQKSHQKQ